jgi:hypothetical protein
MPDKVKNWYEELPKNLKRESKLDKNYKKHYIQPNSMICCIGGTGSGKTNALCDWVSRKNEAFYDVIYFNPVSSDEPLLNMLKFQEIPSHSKRQKNYTKSYRPNAEISKMGGITKLMMQLGLPLRIKPLQRGKSIKKNQ